MNIRLRRSFVGQTGFTYRLFDGIAYSGTGIVSLTTENHAPQPNADGKQDSYFVTHDKMKKIVPSGVLENDRDPDQDLLEVHLVDSPAHGKFFLHPDGGFVYIPDPGYLSGNEPDHFSYKLWDGIVFSPPVSVSSNVVNHAPVAVDDSLSVQKDRPLIDNVLGTQFRTQGADSDPDEDTLTAILVGVPAHGTVTLQPSGEFAYIATPGYTGPDSFTYQLNDGLANSRVAKVFINVNESAPKAVNDSYSVAHNTTLRLPVHDLASYWSWLRYQDRYGFNYSNTILANDQDADFDRLSIRAKSTPKYGTLSFDSDGSVAYAPRPNITTKTRLPIPYLTALSKVRPQQSPLRLQTLTPRLTL